MESWRPQLWYISAGQTSHWDNSLPISSDDPPNLVCPVNWPMQLTPNFLECIVATIILNEVEKKNITVEDFLFSYKVMKQPQTLKLLPNSLWLSISLSQSIMCTLGNWQLTKTGIVPMGCLWSALTGYHHTSTVLHSPLLTNSLIITFIIALLWSLTIFYYISF